jgi:hypothetical protein
VLASNEISLKRKWLAALAAKLKAIVPVTKQKPHVHQTEEF